MFSITDYTYSLPSSLIAQESIHPSHDARMMIIDRDSGKISHETIFWNLDLYLGTDRVLFFNDSRVIRSRVILKNIPYITSNKSEWIINGEIFYLWSISETSFNALIRPGNKFKIGTIFEIGEYKIEVTEMTETGRILKLNNWTTLSFLEKYGALPLPPYIRYTPEKEIDYQTVFAKNDWSVAAPTASLHFTQELLEKIQCPKEYLTLHIWLWTFQWIKTSDIRDYNIHSEKIELSFDIFEKIAEIKYNNKKIVAVGTTATRTLESLPYLWKKMIATDTTVFNAKTRKYWNTITSDIKNNEWIDNISIIWNNTSIHFDTSIYITPWFNFLIINDLITNFHLSESSLLVLVSAFIGNDKTKSIYKDAIKKWYRFYSFGDGMYIRWK